LAIAGSCHDTTTTKKEKRPSDGEHITIALAGNANVGKSVIFNHLTGSHQTIGNWPGKTVERAEGTLHFDGYDASIIDLPGIYSFSTFSLEELVTREYIAHEKPNAIINVIGASVLERNIYFTLQLLDMDIPLVICLNQMDIAESKGITIDAKKLETILGVPVVPTVASRGKGIHELIQRALDVAQDRHETRGNAVEFGDVVETRIKKLTRAIESEQLNLGYASRWVAIKLLEDDSEIKKLVGSKSDSVISVSETMAKEVEDVYKESCFSVIASERYSKANQIAADVQIQEIPKTSFSDRLDWFTTHKVFGYLTAFVVIAGLLLWTFTVGNYLSGWLSHLLSFFESANPKLTGSIGDILWNGAFGGIVAGVTLVIPFVVPFYFVLAAIEDSGILTRVAFMFDNFMHRMGLHGKAIIPMILGYGCNVPAIYGCRVMGTRREKLLAAFAITFIPCTARTIIILGLVAAFVSIKWALALYAIDLVVIFALGRIALRVVPGTSTGLIMEMHQFRVPSLSVVAKQTWARTKSLIFMVFPIYVIGSAAVQGLYALGWLGPINHALSPVTVTWLGLPLISGILLVFGLIRKEMIVLTLVPLLGTQNFSLYLTQTQLIVLAFVSMLYIPCLATITALVKEFGWKPAGAISMANLVSAILLGGVAVRLLTLAF
jgi:ferrous iron transport protein B